MCTCLDPCTVCVCAHMCKEGRFWSACIHANKNASLDSFFFVFVFMWAFQCICVRHAYTYIHTHTHVHVYILHGVNQVTKSVAIGEGQIEQAKYPAHNNHT